MFRTLTVIAFAIFPATAFANADTARLDARLALYFDAVNVNALSPTAQSRAWNVLENNSATHVETVLKLHSILAASDAIEHVDIHGLDDVQTAASGQ